MMNSTRYCVSLLCQVELTKRTMGDGSFAAMMLQTDKVEPALKSPDMVRFLTAG